MINSKILKEIKNYPDHLEELQGEGFFDLNSNVNSHTIRRAVEHTMKEQLARKPKFWANAVAETYPFSGQRVIIADPDVADPFYAMYEIHDVDEDAQTMELVHVDFAGIWHPEPTPKEMIKKVHFSDVIINIDCVVAEVELDCFDDNDFVMKPDKIEHEWVFEGKHEQMIESVEVLEKI